MKLSVLLILYPIFFADYGFGKLCSRRIPIHRTKQVLRTSVRLVSTRNWVGWIKTQLQPYTYYDTEFYLSFETEFDCCFGYTKVDGNCEPICPSGCQLNAYCAQPYICTCKAGYSRSYDHVCSPICENGCQAHSKCTAPNTCECEDNYKMNTKTGKCEPQCNMDCPKNAYCAEPNTCQCRKGYELKAFSSGDIACEPICKSGCQIWSHCVAPDECACVTGYEMINDRCEPKCEPTCGANSHCLAGNNCVCNSGYEFKLGEHKCTPICSVGCPAYSYCVQPETCACDDGYTMNANATQCLPVCNAGCPAHAVCYRPDECLCDEGYRPKQLPDANKTMQCEPICPANCEPYGRCNDSGACECHPGYVLQTTKLSKSSTEPLCQPHCSQGCEHGFCFSPDTCVCNAGYLMGPNKTCKPVCSLDCINAECVEPEICACLPGHRFKDGSVNECEPICEPACSNGICVAPDFCLCKEHFAPDLNQKNLCKPSCEPKCENGDCVGPQNCACWQGYQLKTGSSTECLPICSECDFGVCIAPEICKCHEGFYEERTENGTTCIAIETTSENIVYNFSTTTLSDIDEELPGFACNSHCKCWQNADHERSFQIASCENLCEDNVDGPCLNLDNCYCNLNELHLKCYANKDMSDVEMYRCLMPFNVPTQSSPSEHLNLSNEKQRSTFPWLLTLCIISSGLLAMGGLLVIWRRYQNSRPTDNLMMEFHN